MDFPRNDNILLEGHDTALQFQITDFFVPEADKSKRILSRDPNKREEIDYTKDPDEYKVILYGCTAEGHSVCAEVTNYCPYFFVRIPARYANRPEKELKAWVNEFKMYLLEGSYHDPVYFKKYNKDVMVITKWYKKHLVSVKLEYKKEFMGFTNGTLFPFLKITVRSLALFNRLKYFFQSPPQDFLTKYKEPFKLYESNIDPMLRCIHDLGILPCGWVELPAKCYSVLASGCEDDTYCRTNFTVEAHYKFVKPLDNNATAPLTIVSFDIECTSSHGDFPVAIKDYQKLAKDLITIAQCVRYTKEDLIRWITRAYKEEVLINEICKIHRLYPLEKVSELNLHNSLHEVLDRIMELMKEVTKETADDMSDEEEDVGEKKKLIYYETAIKNILSWKHREKKIPHLPKLQGDAIIQIGTTVHKYGSDEIIYKNIITLKSCDKIEGTDVQSYNTEAEVLYAWKELIRRLDPDILIGYNIFGFDMPYIWDRASELLGSNHNYGVGLGRRTERECVMIEQRLSSAALGDNVLKYFDMDGVVLVDLYKVMQRTPLDSYKLDFVANLYLGDQKNDLKPYEIFEKFKGNSADRKVVAEYCVQDCALVNRLFHKLKVLENNNAMGNVCLVPLSYLFMRGQGVKIFSLVAQFCKNENFAIPVLRNFQEEEEDDTVGYEGATVLNPEEGMYLENAITVLDYSSLYPSSMIERNLSHDCYVNDTAYDNLPGVDYLTVTYDIYEGVGDKKKKVDEKNCKFVQLPNQEKGVIPRILMKLLTQRKNTRKKIEYETIICKDGSKCSGLVKETEHDLNITDIEKKLNWIVQKNQVVSREDTYNNFEKLVFDALQVAYKVTANSLYGQIGSRVSPIYLRDIAACTTATGRERIMMAKDFVESTYPGSKVIYGDTDSIFIKFAFYDKDGKPIIGRDTLPLGIEAGQRASREIKGLLPEPQSLEYEKTMFPFIIFSKKRYVGLLYEDDANKKPKLKSMGIVLKRRDNAPIVKKIYGGIIDILLYKYDLNAAVKFLREELQKLIEGKYPVEELIITKTLKGTYKDRSKIAHCVLADRMTERDPGNKPQVNDRVPYVYIQTTGEVKLQGDRIENPDYIREKNLTPDYQFYISNQLLKPICQIFALCIERLPGYGYSPSYWEQWNEELKTSKIYCDSEMKRKNRIDALREQEAEALLFSAFMDKKRKVRSLASELVVTAGVTKPKKTVTIQKHVLPLDAPKLTFQIVEQKEPKQYKAKMTFFMEHNVILEKDIVIPKKTLTKTQACNHIMIGILKSLVQEYGPILEQQGLLLDIDKYYTRVLKTTLEEHESLLDKLALAEKECDMELYNKYTEMLQSFQAAQLIYKYKHMFL